MTTVVADFSRQPRQCPSAPASPGSGTSASACASSASCSAPSPIFRLASTASLLHPGQRLRPRRSLEQARHLHHHPAQPGATASPAASSAAIAGSPPAPASPPHTLPSEASFHDVPFSQIRTVRNGSLTRTRTRRDPRTTPKTTPEDNSRRKSHTHVTSCRSAGRQILLAERVGHLPMHHSAHRQQKTHGRYRASPHAVARTTAMPHRGASDHDDVTLQWSEVRQGCLSSARRRSGPRPGAWPRAGPTSPARSAARRRRSRRAPATASSRAGTGFPW